MSEELLSETSQPITEEQYKKAIETRDQAQAIINQYGKEQEEAFEKRMKENPIFTDDELVYSAGALCPCGYGLAYPKACGMHHYWDCSAILKGIADTNVKHTDKLPFAFYKVKSENQASANGHTTRGVFKPKESK